MRLAYLSFEEVPSSEVAAGELASVWFPHLTGSVESRLGQFRARELLARLILRRMRKAALTRTMARVRIDLEALVRYEPLTDLIDTTGVSTAVLNVTDGRASLVYANWDSSLRRLCGRSELGLGD